MLSKLGNITFLYVHLKRKRIEDIGWEINLNFKKACYLPLTTPSKFIEHYLYGMSFKDFLNVRLEQLCNRFLADKSKIFENVYFKRGLYRLKPGTANGKLAKCYMDYLNSKFDSKTLIKNKKTVKFQANESILRYEPNFEK